MLGRPGVGGIARAMTDLLGDISLDFVGLEGGDGVRGLALILCGERLLGGSYDRTARGSSLDELVGLLVGISTLRTSRSKRLNMLLDEVCLSFELILYFSRTASELLEIDGSTEMVDCEPLSVLEKSLNDKT